MLLEIYCFIITKIAINLDFKLLPSAYPSTMQEDVLEYAIKSKKLCRSEMTRLVYPPQYKLNMENCESFQKSLNSLCNRLSEATANHGRKELNSDCIWNRMVDFGKELAHTWQSHLYLDTSNRIIIPGDRQHFHQNYNSFGSSNPLNLNSKVW